MSRAIVDIVLLLLLVAFFRMRQRGSVPLYFRYWFIGWCAGLLGFAASLLPLLPFESMGLHEVIRWDPILFGSICFAASFLITPGPTSRGIFYLLLLGTLFGVPCDILMLFDPPNLVLRWLCVIMICLGHMVVVTLLFRRLPEHSKHLRLTILIIGIGTAAFVAFGFLLRPSNDLPDWISVEVYLCCAVSFATYGYFGPRHSRASVLAVFGFLLWAGFCLMHYLLPDTSRALEAIYGIWTVPKWCVAFSMILISFEEANAEKTSLLTSVQTLYEDFRLLYDTHPYPMWIMDRRRERFMSLNQTAVKLYGLSDEQWQTKHPKELEYRGEEVKNHVYGLQTLFGLGAVKQHRYAGGTFGWVTLVEHIVVFQGMPAILVIARDITEQLETSQNLVYRADHDVLTGLPNRHLFNRRLKQCLDTCSQNLSIGALLTIDIDHFKSINDTYGHPVGDECLRLVASRLLGQVRQVDMVARVGGEEFCVVLGDVTNIDDVATISENLLRIFDPPLHMTNCTVGVSVSIGVAIYPLDGLNLEELILKSDQALYAAKRAGRNRAIRASTLTRGNEHGIQL
jgi:diguanylate cyclase (GGDEF)-like protein/PAS domain S-box-containing protein